MTAGDPAYLDGNSDEYKAGAMLLESFRKIAELNVSIRKFRVHPRSSLAGDDRATSYERLSSQVETCIQGAIDNVNALQTLMIEARMLPAFAHFGLLRNALEMVGTGFWLLGPPSRDERVLRSLQLTFESRRDYLNAANELHRISVRFPTDDPVRLELEAQRDRRTTIAGRSLNPPSISSRLRGSQRYSAEQPYTILGFWRLASGAMHGRREVLKNLLEHEVIETGPEDIRTSTTSGVIVVANILQHIEVYLFELSILMIERGSPL